MKTIRCTHCGGTGQVLDYRWLGNDLRGKRVAAGLSCREMAKRLKLSAPYLSDLERGNRKWSANNIALYLKQLKAGAALIKALKKAAE